MVLGSLVDGMTYPKSLYLTGQAYGFTYFTLFIDPPGAWDDENNRWLASLYGLSYERIMAKEESYLSTMWHYVQQGVPVLACRAWFGVSETGSRITAGGKRLFWWEGMSKKSRTRIHYLVVTGMDKSSGTLYLNDPIYCWRGVKAEYTPFDVNRFRRLAGKTPQMHRYIIKAFDKTDASRKGQQEIQELVKERIIRKLEGDPKVYDTPDAWRSFFGIRSTPEVTYGVDGLKAFRDDLKPDRFKKILEFIETRREMSPVDRLTYLNLFIYHRVMVTSIASEYLEANNLTKEWKWLMELHMLYEKLWVSTTEICAKLRISDGLDEAVAASRPALREMRDSIGEMIEQFQSYLNSNAA